MKRTKRQYLPQVMYKKYNAGNWTNILSMDVNGGKRYADSLKEAKQAIENTRKYWEDEMRGKRTTQKCGMITISSEPIKDDTFEIVDTRIRVREVTEWELVK